MLYVCITMMLCGFGELFGTFGVRSSCAMWVRCSICIVCMCCFRLLFHSLTDLFVSLVVVSIVSADISSVAAEGELNERPVPVLRALVPAVLQVTHPLGEYFVALRW